MVLSKLFVFTFQEVSVVDMLALFFRLISHYFSMMASFLHI